MWMVMINKIKKILDKCVEDSKLTILTSSYYIPVPYQMGTLRRRDYNEWPSECKFPASAVAVPQPEQYWHNDWGTKQPENTKIFH